MEAERVAETARRAEEKKARDVDQAGRTKELGSLGRGGGRGGARVGLRGRGECTSDHLAIQVQQEIRAIFESD